MCEASWLREPPAPLLDAPEIIRRIAGFIALCD
jgi:hypothetical protein